MAIVARGPVASSDLGHPVEKTSQLVLIDKYRLAVERIIDGVIRLIYELRVDLSLGSHDLKCSDRV